MLDELPSKTSLFYKKLIDEIDKLLLKLTPFAPKFLKLLKLENIIYIPRKKVEFLSAAFLSLLLIGVIFADSRPVQAVKKTTVQTAKNIIVASQPLEPIQQTKSVHEVFGFAPYWTLSKLDNVDWDTLTTLAYFSVPVSGDGNIDVYDKGYQMFKSGQATDVFKTAHAHGTRVVLTVTQMNNFQILALLDNPDAQNNAIDQITSEVKDRGIDGVNVDFEYGGNPGDAHRTAFSLFVQNLTDRMHQEVPGSYVTVSVYAAAAKGNKLYDIGSLADASDAIFMMAYDYANASSGQAMPTAPLYGYKEGKYWYDVSTAVNDFLAVMPAQKLILGVPWYGYNYAVYQPSVDSQTLSQSGKSQTYSIAEANITPDSYGISNYIEGWDDIGKVSWKAYFDTLTRTWRMIFLDDPRSLSEKIDFASQNNLAGVGMWALGFDNGRSDLWSVLKDKFGAKLASTAVGGQISEDN